jgi:hypothetical protein
MVCNSTLIMTNCGDVCCETTLHYLSYTYMPLLLPLFIGMIILIIYTYIRGRK